METKNNDLENDALEETPDAIEEEIVEPEKYFSDAETAAMFFIPIIGFMVYATTLNINPDKAKKALMVSVILPAAIFGILLARYLYNM